MNQDSNSQETIKDMSEYFTTKLSQLLEEIDLYKRELGEDVTKIKKLDYVIHALFLKISPKLKPSEKKLQWKFHKVLHSVAPIERERRQDPQTGNVQENMYPTKHYQRCIKLLERRELHLNDCMERLGLTIKQKKGGLL